MQTLLDKTLALLRESREPVSELSRRAGVKSRWLRRLMDGDFEDPGVNKIERLHYCLTNPDVDYTEQRAA